MGRALVLSQAECSRCPADSSFSPRALTQKRSCFPLSRVLWDAYLVASRGGGTRWYLLSGALGAVAVLTKSVAIWNLVFLGMACFLSCVRSPERDFAVWRAPAAMVAGALGILAVVLAPFIIYGGFQDFLYSNVSYNSLYARQESLRRATIDDVGALGTFIHAAAPLVAASLMGAVVGARRKWPAVGLITGWTVVTLIGTLSTGHAFAHYYQTLLPGMALMAAPLAMGLPFRFNLLGAVGMFCLAVSCVACARFNLPLIFSGSSTSRITLESSEVYADRAVSNRTIAAYLKSRTSPDDTIYNYGRDSQIYFYASRAPATRYFYDRSFWLDPTTLDETVRELRSNPPKYLVDTGAGPDEDTYYPGSISSILDELYVYEGQVEYAQVYRLKD